MNVYKYMMASVFKICLRLAVSQNEEQRLKTLLLKFSMDIRMYSIVFLIQVDNELQYCNPI